MSWIRPRLLVALSSMVVVLTVVGGALPMAVLHLPRDGAGSMGSAAASEPTFSIPVGATPTSVTFDPANGDLYVTDSGSNHVSVINGTANTVVGSFSAFRAPWDSAIDSSTGDLYVTEAATNNVTVFNGVTDQVAGSIPTGFAPIGAAFDSTNGDVYVANGGSANITVIDGASRANIGSIVMNGPESFAFDPTNGFLYATAQEMNFTGANAVAVIDGATNQITGWIHVGSTTRGIAFDPVNGDLYAVEDYTSAPFTRGGVEVIDSSTGQVVATVFVGFMPQGVAVDSSNNYIYVANSQDDNLTVIDGASNTVVGSIPVGANPSGLTYDPQNGYVYVANEVSDNLTAFFGGAPPVPPPTWRNSTGTGASSGLGSFLLIVGVLGIAAVMVAVLVHLGRQRK